MLAGYTINVVETDLGYIHTAQERIGQQLDRCMSSPYNYHLVVGYNGREELLLVPYNRTATDERVALFEACGYYCSRFRDWPDFFSSRCHIRKIVAKGMASPACLDFVKGRQMLVLSEKDVELCDDELEIGKLEVKLRQVAPLCSDGVEGPKGEKVG